MIKFLLWLLGMPEESGKSGKREAASLLGIFAGVLVAWGFASFDQAGKLSTLYLIVPSALAAMGGAFGMQSLLKQGGLSFESQTSRRIRKGRDNDLHRSKINPDESVG